MPTLNLYGANDKNLGPSSNLDLRVIPNYQSAVLPDASHAAYIDKPALFHSYLYNFLKKLEKKPWKAGQAYNKTLNHPVFQWINQVPKSTRKLATEIFQSSIQLLRWRYLLSSFFQWSLRKLWTNNSFVSVNKFVSTAESEVYGQSNFKNEPEVLTIFNMASAR